MSSLNYNTTLLQLSTQKQIAAPVNAQQINASAYLTLNKNKLITPKEVKEKFSDFRKMIEDNRLDNNSQAKALLNSHR